VCTAQDIMAHMFGRHRPHSWSPKGFPLIGLTSNYSWQYQTGAVGHLFSNTWPFALAHFFAFVRGLTQTCFLFRHVDSASPHQNVVWFRTRSTWLCVNFGAIKRSHLENLDQTGLQLCVPVCSRTVWSAVSGFADIMVNENVSKRLAIPN
jgi:hypothetical protein